MTELEALVEEFAFNVAAQSDAIMRARPGTGNKHAKQSSAALEKLRAHGTAGRDALAALLLHSRVDVRVVAAAFLLRHRTAEAKAVLEEAAKGQGLSALEAKVVLEQWQEGTWTLDAEKRREPVHVDEVHAATEQRVTKRRLLPSQPLVLPDSLRPHRALLEKALAPCILFDKENGDAHSRGCRFGGLPLVPPGTQWPCSPEGPLHFLGQLDFAELAACRGAVLPELPRDGILAFFYDVENQAWGNNPEDSSLWRLVWTPSGADAVPLEPPKELMDWDRSILSPYRLVPSLGFSLPDFWDRRAPVAPDFWSDTQGDDLIELREKLTGGEYVHQVGGHPTWVQDDARTEAQLVSHGVHLDSAEAWDTPEAEKLKPGATEWNLLWQVASDEELDFMWGSAGNLYFLIRDEDLRACRFERAWLILQCT
jgi:uncharacterized protein YwqG